MGEGRGAGGVDTTRGGWGAPVAQQEKKELGNGFNKANRIKRRIQTMKHLIFDFTIS